MFVVFQQGARKLLVSDDGSWTDAKAAWIAAICAAGCAIVVGVIVVPLLKRRVDRVFDE